MNEDELKQYLQFAKNLAKEAGEIMLRYFRADQNIEIKADSSPVTVADKEVNSLVIKRVRESYADHGVLGEEESYEIDADLLWVCDPIDGTVAYTYHLPVAMFSLALVKDGEPVVAVAYNPFTRDIYYATKGTGAYRNEHKLSVSGRKWGKALIGKTYSNAPDDLLDSPQLLKEVTQAGNKIPQTYGCVFKGCLVAEGSIDSQIFPGNGAHDIAGIKLLVEEAGGLVTDLDGQDQVYNKSINGAVLTNGLIHKDLMAVLKKYANFRN
jgi:fructose-1,6-bisphosphatase/inositol monophosphatase family enzyme